MLSSPMRTRPSRRKEEEKVRAEGRKMDPIKKMTSKTRTALELGRSNFFAGPPAYVTTWWKSKAAGKIKADYALKAGKRARD